MPITEPVPQGLHRALRAAVAEHVHTVERRRHPAVVHVGVPQRVRFTHVIEEGVGYDHWLRTDLLEAMVRRARRPGPPPMVWLTRWGPLELCDLDAEWLAAARTAAAELDEPLLLTVMNTHGWRDPASGVQRTWKRLRA